MYTISLYLIYFWLLVYLHNAWHKVSFSFPWRYKTPRTATSKGYWLMMCRLKFRYCWKSPNWRGNANNVTEYVSNNVTGRENSSANISYDLQTYRMTEQRQRLTSASSTGARGVSSWENRVVTAALRITNFPFLQRVTLLPLVTWLQGASAGPHILLLIYAALIYNLNNRLHRVLFECNTFCDLRNKLRKLFFSSGGRWAPYQAQPCLFCLIF